jgi:hypothetical protein
MSHRCPLKYANVACALPMPVAVQHQLPFVALKPTFARKNVISLIGQSEIFDRRIRTPPNARHRNCHNAPGFTVSSSSSRNFSCEVPSRYSVCTGVLYCVSSSYLGSRRYSSPSRMWFSNQIAASGPMGCNVGSSPRVLPICMRSSSVAVSSKAKLSASTTTP